MMLVVDYFGLLDDTVDRVVEEWGDRCIVDRTQAFFKAPVIGAWTFNSARKYFGVPDGAQLWSPYPLPGPSQRNEHPQLNHLVLSMLGHQEEGLPYHRSNDISASSEFLRCSLVGQRMLESTDRDLVRDRRSANFSVLHGSLSRFNQLALPGTGVIGGYSYPFMSTQAIDLAPLHGIGIHAPCLWPEVLQRVGTPASEISRVRHLLPLPIDQRYDRSDMELLAQTVIEHLGLA